MAKKVNSLANMAKSEKEWVRKERKDWNPGCHGAASGIYGLGFIGALVYYIQTAPTFWTGVLGLLKALVWPAMIVYKVLQFLQM